jgi:hypothetical protein
LDLQFPFSMFGFLAEVLRAAIIAKFLWGYVNLWRYNSTKRAMQDGGSGHLQFCSKQHEKRIFRRVCEFASKSQFWTKSVHKWPKYCTLCNYNMAAAAILDFHFLLPVFRFYVEALRVEASAKLLWESLNL